MATCYRFIAVLLAIGQMPVLATADAAQFLAPTDETHTGPWYEPGATRTANLWKPGDPGTPLFLHGTVLATSGAPLADALVELWHTDAAGNYPPLRASLRTRPDGSFRILTVLPGHNRGYRARHIHFVLTHPDHQQLITRIYFKGDVNMAEAPFPQLAVVLEEGRLNGERRLYANPQFVLPPRSSTSR